MVGLSRARGGGPPGAAPGIVEYLVSQLGAAEAARRIREILADDATACKDQPER
jgi:hypothetical protein